jgi:hypothetical protein
MTIDEKIIFALDEELEILGKSYFALGQANKILVEKGVFNNDDIETKQLKRILEEGRIPNSIQTNHKPRQWRISHSETKTRVTKNLDLDTPQKNVVFSDKRDKIAHYRKESNHISLKINGPLILTVVITVGVILFMIIKPAYNDQLVNNGTQSKEDRLFRLTAVISDYFNRNKDLNLCEKFGNLISAEKMSYRTVSPNCYYLIESESNNEIIIKSNWIIIPSASRYAIPDKEFGMPNSFAYKFYFNAEDSIFKQNIVVSFQSGKEKNYAIDRNSINRFINLDSVNHHLKIWEKAKLAWANQILSSSKQEELPISQKVFKFVSYEYDIERPNESGYTTVYETTYHTVDLINLTVIQKSQLNGNWITLTYPINGYYIQKGVLQTNYIFQIHTLGVKEMWFCIDRLSLGYDYLDGTRIAFYNLKVLH